jgi:hypothetical protein
MDAAQKEWGSSHTIAKIGPVTVTTTGVHIYNQDRREDQWKLTVRSAKESGSLLGDKEL